MRKAPKILNTIKNPVCFSQIHYESESKVFWRGSPPAFGGLGTLYDILQLSYIVNSNKVIAKTWKML